MLNLISQGVSLGFSAGSLPGPFQSYLVSTTLALGWRKSIIVILTPLITDGPIILLAVILLKQFPAGLIHLIQIVGGSYLLWIAYGVWKQFRAGATVRTDAPAQSRTLGQALVMNWLSPGPYIFWTSITGPLLVEALNQSVWHGLAFLVAFYGTFLGILAIWVVIFDRLGRLDERVTRALYVVIFIILVVFALSLIGQGLGILSR